MQTIWKHVITTDPVQAITIPQNIKPLKVDVQNGEPCFWYMLDPTAPMTTRHLRLFGTGHQIPSHCGEYVGTFMVDNDAIVIHVFLDGKRAV